jgi:hypothetical protein
MTNAAICTSEVNCHIHTQTIVSGHGRIDMPRILLVLISAVLLGWAAARAAPSIPPFEGTTTADPTLQRDGYATASMFASFAGCTDIDRIVSSIVSPPQGDSMSIKVTERWVLHGCGQTFPFIVNLTGDGEGGTFIAVKKDF